MNTDNINTTTTTTTTTEALIILSEEQYTSSGDLPQWMRDHIVSLIHDEAGDGWDIDIHWTDDESEYTTPECPAELDEIVDAAFDRLIESPGTPPEAEPTPEPYATLIAAIEAAQGTWTGWDWCKDFGLGIDHVYLDGPPSEAELAKLDDVIRCEVERYASRCAANACQAEEAASEALTALREDDLDEAISCLERASDLELTWGDNPTWGPPLLDAAELRDADEEEEEDEEEDEDEELNIESWNTLDTVIYAVHCPEDGIQVDRAVLRRAGNGWLYADDVDGFERMDGDPSYGPSPELTAAGHLAWPFEADFRVVQDESDDLRDEPTPELEDEEDEDDNDAGPTGILEGEWETHISSVSLSAVVRAEEEAGPTGMADLVRYAENYQITVALAVWDDGGPSEAWRLYRTGQEEEEEGMEISRRAAIIIIERS